MSEDLSNLISELREQVLYLQELGVENLDSEFQISNSKFQISDSKFQIPGSKIESPRIEKFVPLEIPITQKNEESAIRNPNSAIGRLSHLPSLSNRISPPIQENQPVREIIETMPKKEVTNENVVV